MRKSLLKMAEDNRTKKDVFCGITAAFEKGKNQAWKNLLIKTANVYLKRLKLPVLSSDDILFGDVYPGAKITNPQFLKLFDLVRNGKAPRMVVLRIERPNRSHLDSTILMDIIYSHGISLHTFYERPDASKENGKKIFHVVSKFHEFEEYQKKSKRCDLTRIKKP